MLTAAAIQVGEDVTGLVGHGAQFVTALKQQSLVISDQAAAAAQASATKTESAELQLKLWLEAQHFQQRLNLLVGLYDSYATSTAMTLGYLDNKLLFKAEEANFKQDSPTFDAENLINSQLCDILTEAEYQPQNVPALSETYRANVGIAALTFAIEINPVINDEGVRLDSIVEWDDLTEQIDAERQIERLISRASDGELTARIDSASFVGFQLLVATNNNRMLDTVVEPINETRRVLEAMEQGDLTANMNRITKASMLNYKRL